MLRVRLLLLLFALSLFGTRAHAQVTSLRLNSDPGDYIGGGQFTFLTPPPTAPSVPNKTLIKGFPSPFSVSPARFGFLTSPPRTNNS
jgi:hypothetical protein